MAEGGGPMKTSPAVAQAWPDRGNDEGEHGQRGSHDRGTAEDRRQAQPGVLQGADAEGRDTVPELVKGDHATCHSRGDGGQFFLAEADRQRQ